MSSNQELLWNYYQEELKQATLHEASRSSITNLILIITGVIISIITYDGFINESDIYLALVLVVIGIFGTLANAKYYERYYFHYSRAKGYQCLLEGEFPEISFTLKRNDSDLVTANKFFVVTRIRLNWLWLILNLIISVFGIILTIKIYT